MRANRFGLLAIALPAVFLLVPADPAAAHIRLTRQRATPGPVVQAHWLDSELPLLSVIDASNNDIPAATALAIVQASARTWEDVNTSYFTVNPVDVTVHPGAKPAALDAGDGQNSVFFDETGENFPTAGVIAFVRSIVDLSNGHTLDADMVFNDFAFFSSTSSPFLSPAPAGQSSVDLQSVITHEYGHYFGLDHTSIANSTMIPFIIANTIANTSQRTLELDDRSGISAIFPESAARGLSPGAVDFLATTGTVSGTVISGFDGSAVFGAHVEASNLANPSPAASISAISGELTLRDGRGDFTIRGLPPGNYAIRIVPLDGRHTIASDGNVGGVFNGLDINFEGEFWNGDNESGNGFEDSAADFTAVAVAAGTDSPGVDFITNASPGRVIVAQHGQFESTVTFTNNAFLGVRFDLPFEPPYKITQVEFPSVTFNGVPANFVSIRLVPMNPATGLPDLANPLFTRAPFAGSPNGVNTILLDLDITEADRTLFWLVQFPAQQPGFPSNYPFMRMDFNNMELGLFGNSYVFGTTGTTGALLIDRNLTVTMTLQISPPEAVPITATSAMGANRRATHTEFSYASPGEVRLDGVPTEKNALDRVDLLGRTAFGPTAVLTPEASGGAGAGVIRVDPPPSSTALRIWSTQAVDKSGRRSLPSSVTITGTVPGTALSEDPDEPNGRINEATLLSGPTTRVDTYWPAGDKDYFAVMASPGSVIDIRLTAPNDATNGLNLTLLLFDHTGHLVAFNNDSVGVNPRITYAVPAEEAPARRFRFLVTDLQGSAFDPASPPRVKTPVTYTLQVSVTAP